MRNRCKNSLANGSHILIFESGRPHWGILIPPSRWLSFCSPCCVWVVWSSAWQAVQEAWGVWVWGVWGVVDTGSYYFCPSIFDYNDLNLGSWSMEHCSQQNAFQVSEAYNVYTDPCIYVYTFFFCHDHESGEWIPPRRWFLLQYGQFPAL